LITDQRTPSSLGVSAYIISGTSSSFSTLPRYLLPSMYLAQTLDQSASLGLERTLG
jgi:hypothetical protein